MKIVFVAAEMVPFAKTGGLGDVIGSLTGEIQNLGHQVVAFLPKYREVTEKNLNLEVAIDRLEVPLGTEKEVGRIFKTQLENGVQVYFVDHPDFFDREQIYGTPMGDYPDNDRRFTFFQRAVLETLRALGLSPDVLHCHDWHTGLIPVYLKTLYAKDTFFKKTRTVFTIHNLAYQGNFPPDSLPATGIDWEHFTIEGLEFYGKVSFMKGALVYSDMVTTVSERYAKEIQTQEFGCAMDGVLRHRRDTIHGIVNGIDIKEWDPQRDPDLVENFSAQDLDGKWKNKSALQKENGFNVDPKTPVLGIVSRLVDQKGIDILISTMEPLLELGVQLVLLGTGEERYHHLLRELAKKNKKRLGIHILFDPVMAKNIYAGCDMMLLPSYYEPCGLGQMIALRFGTIPIVRATGGLADTIQDFQVKTKKGNGFVFVSYSPEALLKTAQRAVEVFRDSKAWETIVQNAMACDFSWAASAKQYVRLYQMTRRRTAGGTGK